MDDGLQEARTKHAEARGSPAADLIWSNHRIFELKAYFTSLYLSKIVFGETDGWLQGCSDKKTKLELHKKFLKKDNLCKMLLKTYRGTGMRYP